MDQLQWDILRLFQELPVSIFGLRKLSHIALLSDLARLGHSKAAATSALKAMVADGRLKVRADADLATSQKNLWRAKQGKTTPGNAAYIATPRLWTLAREGIPEVGDVPDESSEGRRTPDPRQKRELKRNTKLALALILVRDHPDWSDRTIAVKAGYKSHSSLSKSNTYQAAAVMARGAKEDLPRGSKDAETGNLEAWDSKFEDDSKMD